jgi:hypothetical protein
MAAPVLRTELNISFSGGFKLPRYTTPASNRLEDRPEADKLCQLVESGRLQMLAACRFVSLSHSPSLRSATIP